VAVHLIVEGARTKDRAFDYVLQLNGRRTALTHERWMRHPFQATQLSTRMLAEGLPMIEVRPTVLNFIESMKTLVALVLQKKLAHGVCELADEIMAARAQKPVVAIANSLAASAAYWIGCAASEFYLTPGGEVGSIGVWQAHQDFSRALDEAGVTTTLISAGKFKVEGRLAAKSDVIPVRGTKLAGLDAKDRPVMHNPFSTAARAYLKDMTMLAAELGFTPSSRARLGAAESTVSDVEDPGRKLPSKA